jgi:hypothetical protein
MAANPYPVVAEFDGHTIRRIAIGTRPSASTEHILPRRLPPAA